VKKKPLKKPLQKEVRISKWLDFSFPSATDILGRKHILGFYVHWALQRNKNSY
jgi:hypothetical protein